MIIAQVLATILGLLAILKTYHDYRKHKENIVMFIFWEATWIVIISVALYPYITITISDWLKQPNTGVGTYLGMAFVFLLFIVYRLFNKVTTLEQKLRDVVTKVSLDKSSKKH